MTGIALQEQAEKMKKARPDIRPGYTVRVHQKVQEGEKERIQVFEGLVIGVHRGHSPTDTSFTVRRVASGIGVERVFPLHSPSIAEVEVKKVARIRRAKLNFLRGRSGKSARISERFTSADEFAIAAAQPAKVEAQPEQPVVSVVEQAPAEKQKAQEKAEKK
jgi:large subunit ribosomal protein L19